MARRRKVLVVDDDPVVLVSVRETLEAAGFEVLTREAILGTSALLLQERPDVVLLDIEMPALSGDQLAAMIGGHPELRDTRIIFHSSRPHARLDELVGRSGVLGAIQKTWNSRSFLAQLEHLLERAGAR